MLYKLEINGQISDENVTGVYHWSFELPKSNQVKLSFFCWKIGMKTKYKACWRKNKMNLSWCRILYTKNYQSSLKVEDTLYLCISPLIIRSIYQKRKHRKPPNIELLYDLWFTLIDTCMCKTKFFFFLHIKIFLNFENLHT